MFFLYGFFNEDWILQLLLYKRIGAMKLTRLYTMDYFVFYDISL